MARTPKYLTTFGHDRHGLSKSMIALEVPHAMRAQLVALALQRQTSLSAVVRELLQRGLDDGR